MNKRVYCKLNEPITVGKRSYDFIALDFNPFCLDILGPETMAFPAVRLSDGTFDVADWGDLDAWYDSKPDFERYAKEMNASVIDESEYVYPTY